MHRRTFLALAGIGAVAGCLGGDGDPAAANATARTTADTPRGDANEATETTAEIDVATETESDAGSEPAATETAESTPQPTPVRLGRGVEVRDHRLRTGDDAGESGVLATAVHGGEGHSGRITLRSRFRNDAGEVVAEAESSVADLAPEETWAAYVPYGGEEAVASYELVGRVMAEEEVPSFYHPELSFESFSLRQADSGTYLTATVKNTGEKAVPFLQANGYFHESEHVLLDSKTTTEDLGAGETWSFEIPSEMPAFRRERIGTKTASLTTVPF